GPMKWAAMRRKARFGFAILKNFAPCPGHVDAAAKLVEAFRYGTNSLRVHPGFGRIVKYPDVKQRRFGVEQERADIFRCADFTERRQIVPMVLELPALHRISVVVWHKVLEALASPHRRRGHSRRIEYFQPIERATIRLRQSLALRRAGDERLKQARG